jgi:acyl-CoA hydrolase
MTGLPVPPAGARDTPETPEAVAARDGYSARAMDARPASESRSQLVRWMGVLDANTAGNVHGGTVMKLCDEVAALAAIKHSRQRVVTAAMDRMSFLYPIRVGDLVTVSASVNAAWRTSMEVGVRVDAEDPRAGTARHTNTAYLTMVALDERGNPAPVPRLIAATPDEQRRLREAELRRANRLAEREDFLAQRRRESG